MKPKLRRAAAIVLAALTLAFAWFIYRQDVVFLRTEEQQVQAIFDYASAKSTGWEDTKIRSYLHPVVEFDEIVAGRRVLVFSDSEIDSLVGRVTFRRGLFGGWQPLGAFYTAGQPIGSIRFDEADTVVIYGVDVPQEIASYLMAPKNPPLEETVMARGEVTGENFFHVHETDRNYFPAIYYFDAEGNELQGFHSDPDIPSPSIGSAEINMVYIFMAICLGVGFLIARAVWHGPREEENKSHP